MILSEINITPFKRFVVETLVPITVLTGVFYYAIHRNNLKNREYDKKAPQNSHSERMTIALGQGMSENSNVEVKPTQSETDSSSCFGISFFNKESIPQSNPVLPTPAQTSPQKTVSQGQNSNSSTTVQNHFRHSANTDQGVTQNFVHSSIHLKEIIDTQKKTLQELCQYASEGKWEPLATHVGEGFDWWMFPVDRPSQQQGQKYTVYPGDIQILLQNKIFMESYIKGVKLVAKSWGIDGLDSTIDQTYSLNSSQRYWRNWDVRLGKMLSSLKLFGQYELYNDIVKQVVQRGIDQKISQRWIKDLLRLIPVPVERPREETRLKA